MWTALAWERNAVSLRGLASKVHTFGLDLFCRGLDVRFESVRQFGDPGQEERFGG
jgi:hypothetical protein